MPITAVEAAQMIPEGIPSLLGAVLIEVLSYERGSCPPRRRIELTTPRKVLNWYIRSGWLAAWEEGPESEPAVTLSPWTAELLNVHLIDVVLPIDGRKVLTSVWGHPSETDDQERARVRGFSLVDVEILKLYRDPAPDVVELLIDEETRQAVKLFAGPNGQGAGHTVKIDRKLGKKTNRAERATHADVLAYLSKGTRKRKNRLVQTSS